MEPKNVTNLTELAGSPLAPAIASNDVDEASWFEALAGAWGNVLDTQAQKITDLSGEVGNGGENPSGLVDLTAESLRMQFLANSQSTSTNSVGQALETMARKQ